MAQATEQPREQVRELTRDLLSRHDPATTPAEEFWGAQFDAGLAWIHFPKGQGGLGLSPDLQLIVDEELHAVGAPSNVLRNFMGVGMAGPTLIGHGTPEQQERLLRPLFTCEEIWCQLFSEPGAGSDLAALSASAVREGDEWIINGQKVWTTLAHVARWGLLLVRTDPQQPKHRGLSYFVVDMHAPGVDVRPLRQMTGEAEFNEVWFTDVRIPDTMRIGDIGDGWRVAITTLMNERVALSGLGRPPRNSGPAAQLLRAWERREDKDPAMRDEVVRVWIESELLRLTSIRAEQRRQIGAPGPEGSIGKLAVAENQQRVYELCMDVRGPEALLIADYDMVRPTIMGEGVLGDQRERDLTKAFLTTRGSTIGGGTTDIGRNILAERVLGLPAEPRTDKDLPWSEVPRN